MLFYYYYYYYVVRYVIVFNIILKYRYANVYQNILFRLSVAACACNSCRLPRVDNTEFINPEIRDATVVLITTVSMSSALVHHVVSTSDVGGLGTSCHTHIYTDVKTDECWRFRFLYSLSFKSKMCR